MGDAGTALMGDVRERPFVSVVLPTRNRAHLLLDALGSVLEQDYPADRYEIVVVDDGSMDGTSRVVDANKTDSPAAEESERRQKPGPIGGEGRFDRLSRRRRARTDGMAL